ncbi:DUF4435 domain-containing protein [Streptomyces spiramyceticus]|uniref:DUF4435 domain-containing protein n=1 Tax=Streptomyces spiramyceticus TaxID=299717 RepID=UPI00237C1FEC|nr:DUF4435 domain-containing protein [Streptomyces spiramyceticus]
MLDLLTPDTIANQVSMLRLSMRGPIVLVEGKTDTRVYKRFFLPTPHVRLIYCNGKPVLREAMAKLRARRDDTGVLGICDADYDRILQRRAGENVFYADLHDAETMICYSDAFGRVHEELFDQESSSAEFQRVRDALFTIAAKIGAIRLWNEENKASLKFTGLDAGNYLTDRQQFDIAGYVAALLENSLSARVASNLLLDIAERCNSLAVAEVASGHDFCALLAAEVSITRASDKFTILPQAVEAMLRLSFDDASFSKTELALNLSQWEQSADLDLMTDTACPTVG